ncbi:PAS domain-containing sensor histidine kinase [Collibacillus ludicampi]|uniref:histidine kinase n=1 Tax=Collibacillus ludicampi TaxID=2771369 RepID=A0AAV4LEI0_9BACL|nr:ATP-binding protein [Collibacillus ludicampi]GIM45852.1 PAS domain-containing sensor histidine kinase [Collibacillus ludicampi]
MFRSIRWKLVMIYLLLILFAMQLIGVYFIRSLNMYFLGNFSKTINSQAGLLAELVPHYLEKEVTDEADGDLENLARSFAELTGADIYILNKNGIIVATSEDRSYVGQKRVRTEVTWALSGTKEEVIRVDEKTGMRYTFLAVPVRDAGQVIGAVYLVAPMKTIYQTMSEINWIFYTGILIALVLTAILGIMLARTITHPIMEITKKAKAMAKGDFGQEVAVKGDDEIGELGLTFNYLTHRLRDALAENEQEKDKMEAILAHMSDGVIAVSAQGLILLANPVAQELLMVEEKDLINHPLHEVLEVDEWEGPEMKFRGPDGRILYAYASTLKGAEGEKPGQVIVLRDITEEEKEEKARRDFVANVSHEIRTPLTTLKSYIEALEDGAMYDPQLSAHFLRVIHNETDRMVRLVNDLLQLSRFDSGTEGWNFSPQSLAGLLDRAVERFSVQCRNQGIGMFVEVEPRLPQVVVDRDKLDQVLDNLISNALKYTPEKGMIRLAASRDGDMVVVKVIDTGIGIPKKDLPRIFERFYRVDKARSRKLGGTGLGLSIAQQIIEKHGGKIQIESELGRGTTVLFTLPVAKEGVA